MRLPLSGLPARFRHVRDKVNEFRQAVEDATAARNGGTINAYQAARIQTAARAERAAQVAEKLMRDEWADLTLDDKLAIQERIVQHSIQRDKCLAAIGLDVKPSRSAWDVLDATPLNETRRDDSEAVPTAERNGGDPVPSSKPSEEK